MKREPYITQKNIAGRTGAWIAALEGSRGRRGLPALRDSALVLIDLQRLFTDPSSPAFIPAWEAIAGNIRALVSSFADRRLPIVATRHIHRGGPGVLGRFFERPIVPSDPLSELDGFVSELPAGIPVFEKDTFAGFANGLPPALEGAGHVIICGVQSQRCILATAIDLHRHGVAPVVAADATAAPDERTHMEALRILSDGHAFVATTGEILKALSGGARR